MGAIPWGFSLCPEGGGNGAYKAQAPLFVSRLSQADGRQVLRGARQDGGPTLREVRLVTRLYAAGMAAAWKRIRDRVHPGASAV